MSLYEAFGVGKLLVYGRFQEVEDRVVPNGVLGNLQRPPVDLTSYPSIPEYLAKFPRKGLAFPAASRLSPGAPLEAVFFDGEKVVACVTSIEGTPHYFLSQRGRRFLRDAGQSIVRTYRDGSMVLVALDTRAVPFGTQSAPARGLAYHDFFREDWRDPAGLLVDYVIPRRGLTYFLEHEGAPTLIGSTEEGRTVADYFRSQGGRGEPPFDDGLGWQAWSRDGDVVLAWRDVEGYGTQLFLTREAYRRLRDRDLAVVQAVLPSRDALPRELRLVWTEEEVTT